MLNTSFLGLLLAGSLAAASTPALAQTALANTTRPATTTAADRTEALTTNMAQALSLTPAQVEKVRAINTTAVRNVEAARQRYGQAPAKLRNYIEDISLARLDRLKEVLTSTQFIRYQQKREEKMGIPTVRSNQGNLPPGLNSNHSDDN